jgi:AraC-like DNA-binding protein
MSASPHGNSVILLRPVATVLHRLGVDGDRFLADVGVAVDTPPDAYVPNVRVDRALEAIAARRGDEAFGLTMAREASARPPLGLFGQLVWLSGTLREALTRAARFYSLVTQRATLSLEVEDGRLARFTQRRVAGAERGTILSDYAFGSLVLRARAAAGPRFAVRAMRFAHGGRTAAPYESLFDAAVTLDGRDAGHAGVDELTMDACMLDLPLSGADPFTAEAIEAHADRIRARAAAPGPLATRVKAVVEAELRSGRPLLGSVAARLGMGGRSLRRRLEDQRLSLRAIVESARRDLASELLASGTSIKEVAFRLGFSEPSAFSRAYKRWTGRSPSSHR